MDSPLPGVQLWQVRHKSSPCNVAFSFSLATTAVWVAGLAIVFRHGICKLGRLVNPRTMVLNPSSFTTETLMSADEESKNEPLVNSKLLPVHVLGLVIN